MKSFDDLVRATGEPAGWSDALAAIRAEHGSRTSRYLADRFGVTMRTAQRWQKGTHAPASADVRAALPDMVDRDRLAAQRIREAQRFDPGGEVRIMTSSKGGPRKVSGAGWRVTPDVRDRLDLVASALESGDRSGAEREFSDLVTDLYFRQGRGDRPLGRRARSAVQGMRVDGYGDHARFLGK